MAIKSILITNTEMVRAILDGSKTCIRQIIKGYIPQNAQFGYSVFTPDGAISCRGLFETAGRPGYGEKFFKLPYQSGDILYVRETVWQKTWHYLDVNGETKAVWYNEFRYAASDEIPKAWNYSWAKRPSIHMPKEAARIWLKVTAVRAERLQEITEDGAKVEGMPDDFDYPVSKIYCPICKGYGTIDSRNPSSLGHEEIDCPNCDSQRKRFANLWNATIKKQYNMHSWDANPWVWVIEFERCEKPEIN